MWTASREQPSGTTGDASGRPKVSGGSENMGERLPQLRIASNSQPGTEPEPEPEPDPLWSYVSGGTMGDSFSIAGMAGAVWMANASSPAAYGITESDRVECQEGLVSQREERKRERNELGVGPSNPTTSMPGKLVSEAVSIAPAGGYWNAVASPA